MRDTIYPFDSAEKALGKVLAKQECDSLLRGKQVFSSQQSKYLIIDEVTLDKLLADRNLSVRNFGKRRLKLLFDRCSKEVRAGKISLETVNRLSSFCLEIIPLIESGKIVMPTAAEIGIFFNWCLDKLSRSRQEPVVVLTTVCPDYPFEWFGSKAVFQNGLVGSDIGLIGETILKNAPHLIYILARSLHLPVRWLVGYAGFEAKPENLERMKITAEEFRNRIEASAYKLQQELDVPVGILPDAAGLTIERFNEIREGFKKSDFDIRRKGMDALSEAVDARDWAGVFYIANRLNAIIVDGASVYMGRKAYKKAEHMLQSTNYTPRFYCVSNYMGFSE